MASYFMYDALLLLLITSYYFQRVHILAKKGKYWVWLLTGLFLWWGGGGSLPII
jgi:hypothetical protein